MRSSIYCRRTYGVPSPPQYKPYKSRMPNTASYLLPSWHSSYLTDLAGMLNVDLDIPYYLPPARVVVGMPSSTPTRIKQAIIETNEINNERKRYKTRYYVRESDKAVS